MKLGGAVLAACATLAASWKFGEHYGGIDISEFEIDNASKTCHHDTMAKKKRKQGQPADDTSGKTTDKPQIVPSRTTTNESR